MNNELYKYKEEAIFALDIGTRTVIGLVCMKRGDKLNILAADMCEHETRSMLDGQIHDINKVAKTVEKVKKRLEEKIGFSLERVAIAAAGRVLKTSSVKVETEVEPLTNITKDIISSLELEGIQKAQCEINDSKREGDLTDFYCVGYSVINYYLNGYVISNPLDHKGKLLSADMIATFLPQSVVDSLYAVTEKVGLKVVSLTLEPIAAINVAIPEELRLLNLALVDIGAGTSDIAISRNGSIVAYGMVPIAGDEVTEKIVQNYLVDFNTAEKVKLDAEKEKTVKFKDILGIEREIASEEILKTVKPAIENLGLEIAKKILEFNEKSPNAVFCVGGGSMAKGITNVIAERLALPTERVALRDRSSIKNIEYTENMEYRGPFVVTAIGIAKTAEEQVGHDFLNVLVDGTQIRLFKSKEINVADAIALTGFNAKNLVGKNGKTLNFELNGERKIIKGGYGKPAEIYLNGEVTSLDKKVADGDSINIKSSINGQDAKAYIKDYVDGLCVKRIKLNNALLDISTKIQLNGQEIKDISEEIKDCDKLDIVDINTIEDLVKIIDVNKEEVDFYVNSSRISLEHHLTDGDKVDFLPKPKETNYREKINMEIAKEEELRKEVREEIEKEKEIIEGFKDSKDAKNIEIKKDEKALELEDKVKINSETKDNDNIDNTNDYYDNTNDYYDSYLNKYSVTVNGDKVFLDSSKKYIFVDIFNYIDFDLSKPQGNIVLKLNGKQASFTDKLKIGDDIEIYWA